MDAIITSEKKFRPLTAWPSDLVAEAVVKLGPLRSPNLELVLHAEDVSVLEMGVDAVRVDVRPTPTPQCLLPRQRTDGEPARACRDAVRIPGKGEDLLSREQLHHCSLRRRHGIQLHPVASSVTCLSKGTLPFQFASRKLA